MHFHIPLQTTICLLMLYILKFVYVNLKKRHILAYTLESELFVCLFV